MSVELAVSHELSLVFPTPILTRTLFTDAFNERLAHIILSHRRNGGGKRAKGGGWQSAPDLLAWPQMEMRLLAAEVFDSVDRINANGAKVERERDAWGSVAKPLRVDGISDNPEGRRPHGRGSVGGNYSPYRGRARANVNGDGHYNPLSVEPHYQWCAIYHVATGSPRLDRVMNGALELVDPRPAAPFSNLEGFAFGRPLEIEPKAGLLVIFPAWLQYCVHPFFGMGQRISITLNITVEEE